jgi:PAS domain S-box-containing protein
MMLSSMLGAGWAHGPKVLWDDEGILLCRACREGADGKRTAVLAALPAAEHPTPQSLDRLAHEYRLKDELDGAWAVKPLELLREPSRTILVLEDPGGEPLSWLVGAPMEVGRFLPLAIKIAAALSRVHQRGLVHKDIKPANILVNRSSGEVRLTGFGIASRRQRDRQSPEAPESIAGTLACMAPEQTGRMNRSIESRSDLYSLGVTLYQMLTGSLPFTASDPMDWVHCHIARRPVPPNERVQNVPAPVAAITMKLLAKTAEDRYQTAAGVERDLGRCLAEWDTHHRIDDFPLGEHDAPDRLLIPEKLYGRAREIETLLGAFDRVVNSGARELVLVSGYSGIGKSAVVYELHKMLVPPRTLFAAGKFDQYKRDIPYATLAQAFQSLIRPLLAKSDAELGCWRGALREALGPNGQLIVDLVPELKLIIGDQPPVPELPPQQAKGRFQMVFRRFISVFARPEHPLALFLDDLQWLDAATLDLLEDLLVRSDLQHLMLIGAYRNNEVNAGHPLRRKLDAISKTGAQVQEIRLAPLARDDLRQLIVDTLRCEQAHAASLAQLVHEKTAGNPFFVIQFLHALTEESLLTFDHDAARWCWDLDRIQAKGYTDNVVDLMVGKLTRLPAETQKALQQLACLGNTAEITALSIVFGTSEDGVHAALWAAVCLELLEWSGGSYKFVHDRFHEAAYSLIPEAARVAAHLRIGRLLAAQTAPEMREEAIFEIVNQLNRGAALITARDERQQLAELNLVASQRAKGSTAYTSALTYLNGAAALYGDDCWECRHELSFAVELNRAECEFLIGELAVAEGRLAALSARAANTVEQATVACLRIDVCTTLDQSDRAITVALDYLRRVGIDWSPHPTEEEVRCEFERIWPRLGSRTIEELIELPLMSDPASLATLDVLTKLFAPAMYRDANLASLVMCRAVNLSLERGNSDGSCFAYVIVGMVAGARFGDYHTAFRLAQLGYDLVEQRGLKRFQARTYLNFAVQVLPWAKHVKDSRDLMCRAFAVANSIGDLIFAAYSRSGIIANLIAAGDPLGEVQREVDHGLGFAQKAGFGIIIDTIASHLALVRTLRGLTPKFGCLDDEQLEEIQIESRFARNPHLAFAEGWYWIRKLQARFFAGDYAAAIEASSRAQPLLWTSVAVVEMAEYHFYGALSRAAVCDSTAADQREPHVAALAAHHRPLKVWAEHCPENFKDRAALVGAEIARIERRDFDAMGLYEEAIQSAHANGFVHNEALANELAGRFYAAGGFEKIAHQYLRDARYCYLRWGADGKVRQLEQLYPRLLVAEDDYSPRTTGASIQQIDVATVVKASQAVSSEIVLPRLIETLMKIALQSAGADRGLLILSRHNDFWIEAEGRASGEGFEAILCHTPLSVADCSEALLRYVIRTEKSVIVDDASRPDPLCDEDYVRCRHPRSILCLPLMKQRTLAGLLYFENSLASRAFTPDRVAVLEFLASQAVISLENARLYADLHTENAERKRTEGALLESQERFRDYAETASDWFWETGPDHLFTDISGRLIGPNTDKTAVIGKSRLSFAADLESEPEKWREHLAILERHEPFRNFEHWCTTDTEGSQRHVSVSGRPVFDRDGRFIGYRGTATDLTKQREAEQQLRQSQKMEAIGQLTGGVAHDFNNVLTVITGSIDILTDSLSDKPQLAAIARMIEEAATRGADLTRQLLAFARKQPLQPRDTDINNLIVNTAKLLRPALGEQIEIDAMLEADCWRALIDPSQLSAALINLAVNARDAMSDGGKLTFATTKLTIRLSASGINPEVNPGDYVVITVSDTGVGIPVAIRDKVFEPFFTTKELGKGTGLGLSMVYGFVKQSGGHITIDSDEGRGTTVRLYLPRAGQEAASAEATTPGELQSGSETILVVEDDALVRGYVTAQLATLGYKTIAAANGPEALALVDRGAAFDLLFTDVIMPEGMNGRELADDIAKRRPGVPVLFTSGYSEEAIVHQGRVDPGIALLTKPYRKADLARMIREALPRQSSPRRR